MCRLAVRVECAGATKVVAERAKRNRPDAARRGGSRATFAALAMAYDMAAANAFSQASVGVGEIVGGCCYVRDMRILAAHCSATKGDGRNKLLG